MEGVSVFLGAYPRSRGGTANEVLGGLAEQGLSPLARGNLLANASLTLSGGPIPARAGEPLAWFPVMAVVRAYPRSRGGTVERASPVLGSLGLSPLARGNHIDGAEVQWRVGPIPARAGEPYGASWAAATVGPIPARAGEPDWAAGKIHEARAYPRSRGGTIR